MRKAFDNGTPEAYKAEAKQRWGETHAYAEYEERRGGDSREKSRELAAGLEAVLAEFARCMERGAAPGSAEAQELVKKLQDYISEHFYTCTDPILSGLGQMYAADERMKDNIDRHAAGTAEFIREAICIRCK